MELACGLLLLAAALVTLGRRSGGRSAALLWGMGLTANALSHPVQTSLAVEFILSPGVVLGLIFALTLGAAVLGYLFYLLDTDLAAEGKGFPWLALVPLFAMVALSSVFVQDLLALRREPLPASPRPLPRAGRSPGCRRTAGWSASPWSA